jgi:hypothetical protein
MTNEEIITLGGDFDDFLMKVIMNYSSVSYAELAATIMARMVALSRQSDSEDVILRLLPVIKQSIIAGMDDKPLH